MKTIKYRGYEIVPHVTYSIRLEGSTTPADYTLTDAKREVDRVERQRREDERREAKRAPKSPRNPTKRRTSRRKK